MLYGVRRQVHFGRRRHADIERDIQPDAENERGFCPISAASLPMCSQVSAIDHGAGDYRRIEGDPADAGQVDVAVALRDSVPQPEER